MGTEPRRYTHCMEHHVYFWLKDERQNSADRAEFEKALAGLFEMVPTINSIKDGHTSIDALSKDTLALMKLKFNTYLVDIFGLKDERGQSDEKLSSVLKLISEIRNDARGKKDFATSDKIRNQLLDAGIQLKDDKDGGVSWEII